MPGVPGIQSYSSVAASNITWFPEGMAPSAVNDGMRQVQADLRAWYTDAEWANWGDTPSRASATTFKVTTDVTGRYLVNRRVKCYDASTLYGVVTASSYSAPDTTVTVKTDSGSLTTSLSSVAIAILTPTSQSLPSAIGYKGSDVASASTINLSACGGTFCDVTGTVTITAITSEAAGIQRDVRFTGALTLTHNGTSLILPSAANITTAANDCATFISLGSGNWVCTKYSPAAGISSAGLAYVTIGNTSSLSAERALTAGAGITVTDGGANSTATVKQTTGSVIQTQTATLTTSSTVAVTIAVWADSGLTVNITPSSASSTILVSGFLTWTSTTGSTNVMSQKIVRGSTPIGVSTDAQSNQHVAGGGAYGGASSVTATSVPFCFVDSPATTSATTYKIQITLGATTNAFINRSVTDTNTTAFARYASTITVQELAA